MTTTITMPSIESAGVWIDNRNKQFHGHPLNIA